MPALVNDAEAPAAAQRYAASALRNLATGALLCALIAAHLFERVASMREGGLEYANRA
jgi:hypothetical protein